MQEFITKHTSILIIIWFSQYRINVKLKMGQLLILVSPVRSQHAVLSHDNLIHFIIPQFLVPFHNPHGMLSFLVLPQSYTLSLRLLNTLAEERADFPNAKY